jgi:hypothetical protein
MANRLCHRTEHLPSIPTKAKMGKYTVKITICPNAAELIILDTQHARIHLRLCYLSLMFDI